MEYIIIAIVAMVLIYTVFESKKSGGKPVVKKSVTKTVKKETPSVAELKKLTKVQLLDYADKNNIKVKRSGSKAEVVKSIAQAK
jgi:hypothetical protein